MRITHLRQADLNLLIVFTALAPPARTVRPGTVDKDDIFHFGLRAFKFGGARPDGSTQHRREYGESIKHNYPSFFVLSSAAVSKTKNRHC